MGFLDKAKAAASDLAAKADSAIAGAGASLAGTPNPEALLRDLGILTFLESTGREGSGAERHRIMTSLLELEKVGVLRSFDLKTAAAAAPPPPAAAAAPPPPGAGVVPPPPGAAAAAAVPPPPSAPTDAPAPLGGTAPPPPPPSWA